MKFRKKPVVIEAIQFDGENIQECLEFCKDANVVCVLINNCLHLVISTFEGKMVCAIDDWIIKGIMGEFYPCKDGIFQQTYEKVEEKP